jgi:hypothetical protein
MWRYEKRYKIIVGSATDMREFMLHYIKHAEIKGANKIIQGNKNENTFYAIAGVMVRSGVSACTRHFECCPGQWQ